jgi:hypothetical protein
VARDLKDCCMKLERFDIDRRASNPIEFLHSWVDRQDPEEEAGAQKPVMQNGSDHNLLRFIDMLLFNSVTGRQCLAMRRGSMRAWRRRKNLLRYSCEQLERQRFPTAGEVKILLLAKTKRRAMRATHRFVDIMRRNMLGAQVR